MTKCVDGGWSRYGSSSLQAGRHFATVEISNVKGHKCNYPDFIVIIREGVFNTIKCSLWPYYERQDVDALFA